ncbi:hypothetical protein QAD02_010408 [Eretmocerus hayati]|uniref:Uncharacterized protein n=1 Tax=Eretmocerus hayati TaxID=131215 RepID=A0ACC2NWN4_9HYME|nr:hypothetical protein QAD02_010408 [Eretmocerus hayati]
MPQVRGEEQLKAKASDSQKTGDQGWSSTSMLTGSENIQVCSAKGKNDISQEYVDDLSTRAQNTTNNYKHIKLDQPHAMHTNNNQSCSTINSQNIHYYSSSNYCKPKSSSADSTADGQPEYAHRPMEPEKISSSSIGDLQTPIEPFSVVQLSGPELDAEESTQSLNSKEKLTSHSSATFPLDSKQIKNKRYHLKHKESILARKKIYYHRDKNEILKKYRINNTPRENHDMRNEIHHGHLGKNDLEMELVEETPQECPLNHGESTEVPPKCKERYITKLMENLDSPCTAENRIQVDQLVTRCIHVRGDRVLKLKRVMKKLSTKCELAVSKLGDVSVLDNVEFGTSILCGKPNHHSTTAPYFLETAYDTSMLNQWRETDIDGLDDV